MKALVVIFLSLYAGVLFAQVGIGTEQPNLRAVLDLRSPGNNQGFLAPRLSAEQRTSSVFVSSLTAEENGLLVFDTDDKLFYYWMHPSWKALEAGTNTTLWRSGIGGPQNAMGEEGDFYLDTVFGDIYQKSSGVYLFKINIKGAQGPKGDAGSQGPTGANGAAGAKGDKGDKGDTGATGSQGTQGSQGLKGDKGDKGDTGATGSQGIQGTQGVKGDKGDIGAQGTPGTDGAQGPKGDKGDVGATGAQGTQGVKGDTGAQGTPGADGAQGPKGDKGDTGDQGTPGADGAQGPKGDKGDVGAQGTPGTDGAQGPKGDKGDTGTTGATGAQGVKGDKGDKGDQGIQGDPGKDGNSNLNLRIIQKAQDDALDTDDILIAAAGSGLIYLPGTTKVPGKVYYIRLDAGTDKQPVTIKSFEGEPIVAFNSVVPEVILDAIAPLIGITIVAEPITKRWYIINVIQ